MNPGHHVLYNIHALNHILKRVDEPDAALGVAENERHTSVDGVVYYPKTNTKIVQPELAHKSFEYAQIDGFADPITDKDFPKEFSLGDPIGNLNGV